jgi:hypothetical protein
MTSRIQLHTRKKLICPAWLLLVYSNLLFASSADIDSAVGKYAAGHPDQAIEILRPLAASGNAEAQYLLGNIIYALSATTAADSGDAVTWYKMAAAQDSAEASYALGVIYANQWLTSQDPQHARLAEIYYQKAADLGYEQALGPLMQIATQNRTGKPASKSLTYTNSSFSSGREAAKQQQEKAQSRAPVKQATPELDSLGDPIAEAEKLLQLIDLLKSLQ